ncbi:peroxisome proliferator-activated receptor gamma-like [Physella acuta]|uniref:peroxisome proliferator-activated receptor gamma-like n=1 Tax=Physella acuta TaxID=109671 RepID=UPI0027DADBCF|nr:peroxisome proliferator-activated receptor gamma-like [Physella acuta]
MAELQRMLQGNEVFTFEPMKVLLSGLRSQLTTSHAPAGNLNGTHELNANIRQPLDNLSSQPRYNANTMATPDTPISTPTHSINVNININTTNSNPAHGVPLNINTQLTPRRELDVPSETSARADTNANVINVDKLLEEARMTPNDARKTLINQVTSAIVDAHFATTINTHANALAANERITQQKAAGELTEPENSTVVWKQFMSAMLPEVSKVINFCKKLPGFSEVELGDQMQLIKQGCFEVMVTRIAVLIDEINQEMLDPELKMRCSRDVIRNMPMGPLLDQLFEFAEKFNPLHLSDDEIGLFTAVVIICPDRSGLAGHTTVKTIQQLYQQALYQLIKKNHNDPEKTFTSLMSLMPKLNQINDAHTKFLNVIKSTSPTSFSQQFPQLHKEIFVDN